MTQRTALDNCRIFDGNSEHLSPAASVLIEGDRIVAIAEDSGAHTADTRLDCAGQVLMPGLIDAHFHACAVSVDILQVDSTPPTLLSQKAGALLEAALQRGYTTVRDAGGADYGLSRAVEEGLINGPRLFFSGKALSQTGGHGDMRKRGEIQPCACGYNGVITTLVDGADAMQKSVRSLLQGGAHQIKLMLSGGVVSPTDPIHMVQLTAAELRTAVEEAERFGTYVMAHAHTADAVHHALENGVRSIEHGTVIDEPTAELVAEKNAFVVPTLVTMWALAREGQALGLLPESLEKLHQLADLASRSIRLLHQAGANIGFGTDLLGPLHRYQNREFRLRAESQLGIDVLRSATSVNAELLMRRGELGCIQQGAMADLLVVQGNPLEDVTLFEQAEQNLRLIIKDGAVFKNTLD